MTSYKQDTDFIATLISQMIKTAGWISEKNLISAIWKDVDSSKFENVIDTLLKTGKVVREFKGPNDEKGIWYRSTELIK